jgi:hypothetical protein
LSPPSVTAIILNWCNEIVTTDCIRSLLASGYPALRLLLVDNGSPDDSFEKLKQSFPNIEFLQTGKNLGYAGGNNRGIERALMCDPDYLLILNNDTVLEPCSVGKLVDTAEKEEGKIGGVVPKILYYEEPDRIWYAGGEFSPLLGLGLHWGEGDLDQSNPVKSTCEITFMTGACCLLSTEALRELNGFDEDFFAYVEDADLSLRMTAAGYRMYYQPEARILHRCPLPGTLPSPFQIRQRDVNRRRIMRKHASLAQRLLFLARFYATRLILLLGYVLTRDWQRAQAILQGMGMIQSAP